MAREEKDEQQGDEQEASGKNKGSSLKWVVIGLVLLVIVVGGIVAGVLYITRVTEVKKQQPAEQQQPLVGSMWAMEPFIVNLMDNNGDRYLKAVIQLELSDPIAIPELEQLKPKLRDNVLDLLSAKSYKDLMETGGKERLREEIAMRLSSFMTKGKVIKVYFTEFVVQ